MTNYAVIEITENIYDDAMKEDCIDGIHAKYWFAKVAYRNNLIRYYKFEEPYNVKVSDFFDKFDKDNSVIKIEMV